MTPPPIPVMEPPAPKVEVKVQTPKPIKPPKRLPRVLPSPKEMAVDNRSADALFRLGRDYNTSSHFLEAVDEFNKAISKNPNMAAAYNGRGYSKMRIRDYRGAVADFNKAIALQPGYPNALKNLAAAQRMLEKP